MVSDRRSESLIEFVRRSVIGDRQVVETPYGTRQVVYADYTASGRALSFIEDFLRDVVLPLYANTHTESSGTGRQTTRFREEARDIIRAAFGADEQHAVIFTGTGSTGAIDRMIRVLGLSLPRELDRAYGLSEHIPLEDRPVVFIGPYEHHSNELPWRESIAEVITIPEDSDGHVDLAVLERELMRYEDRKLKIGSFSAASNVTGILTDTRAVSVLLHRHGALAFWDCAAAAPYIDVSMSPKRLDGNGDSRDRELDTKDAIFVSPHKLVGGPGTPGLLIARKDLFANSVPSVPGGGTVAYVNPTEHRYLTDVEQREEGGTPDIVGSIRAGLVFQLKDALGSELIHEREERLIRRAVTAWSDEPAIEVLGHPTAERLSIVSFVIRDGDRHLHHEFVVALLNDLFGIQARGGCSCAGPYGHRLLGIDIERSHAFERAIAGGCDGIKPGWVRINFAWFLDDEVADFLIEAVRLIARHGRNLVDDYVFDPTSGRWMHRNGSPRPLLSLSDVVYGESSVSSSAGAGGSEASDTDLRQVLDASARIMQEASSERSGPLVELPDHIEALRWFPLPGERAAR